MKPEHEQQIGIIRAHHPEGGGENRAAVATLAAMLVSDLVGASEAQRRAMVAAADASERQATRLVRATIALAVMTLGLVAATVGLIVATVNHNRG